MRLYLDNNILIYIENGKYDLSQFLSVSDAEYYYSEIHMRIKSEAVYSYLGIETKAVTADDFLGVK